MSLEAGNKKHGTHTPLSWKLISRLANITYTVRRTARIEGMLRTYKWPVERYIELAML